jgi:GNAT superfamily N-acetyltransferase
LIQAYTGHGHGTRVMGYLLNLYAKSGALSVKVTAPNATPFYKKLGFTHDRGMQTCTLWFTKEWVRAIGFVMNLQYFVIIYDFAASKVSRASVP